MTKRNLLGVDREQPSLFGSPDCGAVARECVDKLMVESRRHDGEQFDSLLMCGASRRSRPSTASMTVGGTLESTAEATSSLTKYGFPSLRA